MKWLIPCDHRQTVRDPGIHSAGHACYLGKSICKQDITALCTAITGTADNHDLAVFRNLIKPVLEYIQGDPDGAFNVTFHPFVRLTHIEDE